NRTVENSEDFIEHEPYKIITKDKKERWVLDQTVIKRDERGEVTHFIGYIIDITKTIELKHENELLRHRVKLAVDSTKDGIWEWNLKTNEAYLSQEWKNMLGYSDSELPNNSETFFKLIRFEDKEKVKNAIDAHLKNSEIPYKTEMRFLCKDGSYKWVLARGKAFFDEDNIPFKMIGSHVDITQQKESERKFNEVFSQLQEAQKIAKIGLWEFTHSNEKVVWSDEMFNIVEIQKEDFDNTYKSFVRVIHPDDLEEFNVAYHDSLSADETCEVTHRLLMPDGRIKYILEKFSTELESDGTPKISRGVVQDITEFKMLDASVRTERQRFKTFIDGASDGLFIINKDLELVDYSKVAKDMLGYSDEEMLKLSVTDWDTKMSKDDLVRYFEELTEKPIVFETVHKRKDGSMYTAAITAVRISTDGENFINASVRDISEMRKLQDALLYEKGFIETIIQSANAVIVAINSDGRMIKFNAYAEKFTGYTQEEISKEPYGWKCLVAPEIIDNLFAIIENAKQGAIVKSYQNPWYSKSGEARMFEWSNALVKKEDGSMDYILSIGLDITQNEEQKAFLKLLMNSQSHMIILADGLGFKYVNQAVLDFFGCNSLDELRSKYSCIYDTFEKDDTYFHLGKVSDDEHWIQTLQSFPAEKQIVSIYSSKHKIKRAFKVNIEDYGQAKARLLTFVDISDTIAKQLQLQYASYHDALTKAYNRAYFDENYQSLLNAHSINEELTAIAMIDIDHFKPINDEHGHSVGDIVLKKLVEIIHTHSRQSDTLVRWGGEEFLLLLSIKNRTNLYKILNSLREKIQNFKMPIIDNITVSIGATLHSSERTVEESIKDADESLYIAKNSGRNKVVVN
ncbi:MAG: PAS domain S-box protein, partial [Campylobacteraceae bacterium]|nr:PAS domain S-box protein [Campylobacteraceae bacterium]